MDEIDILDEVPSVVTAIQHMHRNHRHTEDLKFISNDGKQEFSCHSLIAAVHSWVLCDKIYGSSSCRLIQVEDADNVAIENMIRYFYEEDVIFQNVSDITETKRLSDVYEIPQLGRICMKEFSNLNVNLSNIISVLIPSLKYNDTEKESQCLSLISENKEAVFTSQPFITLSFDCMCNILVKLRDRNSLTESEFLLYGIRWLNTNESVHQKEFLVNKIDVSKILLNEFLDIVVSSPEFFSNVEISHAVNIIRTNACTNEDSRNKIDLFKDAETNTGTEIDHIYKDAESNTETEIDNIYKDVETNTETEIGRIYKDAETNTETEIDHIYKDTETNTRKEIDHIYKDVETNKEMINHQNTGNITKVEFALPVGYKEPEPEPVSRGEQSVLFPGKGYIGIGDLLKEIQEV